MRWLKKISNVARNPTQSIANALGVKTALGNDSNLGAFIRRAEEGITNPVAAVKEIGSTLKRDVGRLGYVTGENQRQNQLEEQERIAREQKAEYERQAELLSRQNRLAFENNQSGVAQTETGGGAGSTYFGDSSRRRKSGSVASALGISV